PSPTRLYPLSLHDALPISADNLFWLGRYLERAEATLRLIRVLAAQHRDPGKGSPAQLNTAERIQRLLLAWGAIEQTSRAGQQQRSEEHTSELQSQSNLVCR